MIQSKQKKNHLATTPISLCRGVIFSDDKVVFHSQQEEENNKDDFVDHEVHVDVNQQQPTVVQHQEQYSCFLDDPRKALVKQDTGLTEAESVTSATYVLDDIPEGEEETEDFTDYSSVVSEDSVFFKSDEELIKLAEVHTRNQRYIAAGRLLRKVQNRRLLTREHREVIVNAKISEDVITEHNTPLSEWTKQAEFHTNRDSIVYYRMDEQHRLVVRVEAIMEESLLVPTMALIAQSGLWKTWMPSFKRPRLGVRDAWKIKDLGGHFNQIVKMAMDLPWPIGNRETIVEARVTDDIEQSGAAVVKIRSLKKGDVRDVEIPTNFIEYDTGMLIRKCPKHHPALSKSKHLYPQNEQLLVMSATIFINPSLNFITRTFCGPLCSTLLRVAEDVRGGKHPQITQAIADNKELYNWVDDRVNQMVH